MADADDMEEIRAQLVSERPEYADAIARMPDEELAKAVKAAFTMERGFQVNLIFGDAVIPFAELTGMLLDRSTVVHEARLNPDLMRMLFGDDDSLAGSEMTRDQYVLDMLHELRRDVDNVIRELEGDIGKERGA